MVWIKCCFLCVSSVQGSISEYKWSSTWYEKELCGPLAASCLHPARSSMQSAAQVPPGLSFKDSFCIDQCIVRSDSTVCAQCVRDAYSSKKKVESRHQLLGQHLPSTGSRRRGSGSPCIMNLSTSEPKSNQFLLLDLLLCQNSNNVGTFPLRHSP